MMLIVRRSGGIEVTNSGFGIATGPPLEETLFPALAATDGASLTTTEPRYTAPKRRGLLKLPGKRGSEYGVDVPRGTYLTLGMTSVGVTLTTRRVGRK